MILKKNRIMPSDEMDRRNVPAERLGDESKAVAARTQDAKFAVGTNARADPKMTQSPNRFIVADGVGRLPQFSHASVAGELIFVSGTLGTLPGGRAQPSMGSEIARTVVKQLGTRQGQQLVRGILGGLFRSR
jgi:hypothetical protein